MAAATKACSAGQSAAESLDSQYRAQAAAAVAALGKFSIGNDDAGNEFSKGFPLDKVTAFFDPAASYNANSDTQSQTGGAITGGLINLFGIPRKAIGQSRGADEQQGQIMQAAQKKTES